MNLYRTVLPTSEHNNKEFQFPRVKTKVGMLIFIFLKIKQSASKRNRLYLCETDFGKLFGLSDFQFEICKI